MEIAVGAVPTHRGGPFFVFERLSLTYLWEILQFLHEYSCQFYYGGVK
jgi:hypothetical protein